ncbi:MAG: hypothetical protein IT196_07375 [Acidimicrobiales bacterium]|nr:hypothetical protein [Acidimicrobiales bacterium]
MYVTAVLSPDHDAFVGWCRSRGYVVVGDGAESRSGRWLAVRVLGPADLTGLTLDRVDYALDFWRRGDRDEVMALDASARSRLRRPPPIVGAGGLGPTPRGR